MNKQTPSPKNSEIAACCMFFTLSIVKQVYYNDEKTQELMPILMLLSKDEVRKIARLARLNLSDEEIERYQKELSEILDYVKKLDNINTDNIEPLYQVTGLTHVTRGDDPACVPDEILAKLIKASPHGIAGNQFVVKNVLGNC